MSDKIQYKELLDSTKWTPSNYGLIQSKTEDLKSQYDIIFNTKTSEKQTQDDFLVKIKLNLRVNNGSIQTKTAYIPGVPSFQSKYLTYKFEFPKEKDVKYTLSDWVVELVGEFDLKETSLKLDLNSSPGITAPPSENIADTTNIATATPPYKKLPTLLGNSYYLSYMPLMYDGNKYETMITVDGESSFKVVETGVLVNKFVSRQYEWVNDSFVFKSKIMEDTLIEFENTCQFETNSEKLYKSITSSGFKCIYTNIHLPKSQDNTFYNWWYSLPYELSNYKYWSIYNSVYNNYPAMFIIAGDSLTQSDLKNRYKYACKINDTQNSNTSRVWRFNEEQVSFVDLGIINFKNGEISITDYSNYCNSIRLRDILKMGYIDSVLLGGN